MISQIKDRLKKLLVNADDAHDFSHAEAVFEHSRKACEGLDADISLVIQLASLLHDADDHKLFPESSNYSNAREILGNFPEIETVIKMISLVSCSKNGDNIDPELPEYFYIPRYSDRLEAIGEIGIKRCYQYTLHTNRSLFNESTPRATTEDELWQIATPERYVGYRGKSASMIDHYYDKLLHLTNPPPIKNKYLVAETLRRRQTMIDYCIEFGRLGRIQEARLH